MCRVCDAAMNAISPTGGGATADAWSRAEAAIKAWRATLPLDAGFDSTLDEAMAWCDHIEKTTTRRDVAPQQRRRKK